MTKEIEGRAEEYVNKNFSRIGDDMPMNEGMKILYIEAATEQRKIDIELFGEWLEEHVMDYVSYDHLNGIDIDYSNIMKGLCKTLEEEQ